MNHRQYLRPVYILSAVRTPIGSYLGALSSLPATKLGAIAVREAVRRAGISPEDVNEVFYGNVLSAGLGQAPAKQVTLGAELPEHVPCTAVNKVCASGMKATIIGAQTIQLGFNQVVVTGGMESMSRVPYYVEGVRAGLKFGHSRLIDGMIHDGLWDPYYNEHMANCTEACVRKMNIPREEQDRYAEQSYRRAEQAWQKGWFTWEVVPVEVPTRKGTEMVSEDEEYKRVDYEKMHKLPPVFEKDGTITAANASKLSDGAAALVLASEEFVEERGLTPIARIIGYADNSTNPRDFPVAPHLAVKRLLELTGFDKDRVDFWEINEAFSAVVIANMRLLDIPHEKVNVFGGAVSLGHPIGCSGARIIVTLINVLRVHGARYGIATLCNGGGGASAVLVEKL